MRKAIRYIALSMTIALTGFSGGAKSVPGIPPVDVPQQASAQHEVWKASGQGAALRELDRRTPGRRFRNLLQQDGIVDFRPDLLTGLTSSAPSPAQTISRLPMSRIPGGSNLCGFIAYNELGLDLGIYRIPLAASQQLTQLRGTKGMLSSFRGGASSDRYYVMSYFGTTIQNGVDQCLTAIFDLRDWKLLAEAGDYGQYERVGSDMTFDPVTQRFYGCFLNRNQSQWVLGYMQLDPASPSSTIAAVTQLCTLEVSLNGLAADANGTLWGIRNDNGDLVTINRKTGEMTKVASTGLVPGYNGSLTWDNTNGILYWAVTYEDASAPSGMSSAILTVDKTTGALAHAYNYASPAQTGGLYTEYTAAGKAPGEFTGFNVAFEGESLSGAVNFDAPSSLSDGTAASGALTYNLTVAKDNGYVAYNSDLTCSYGDKGVTVPLTLSTPGNYTFTIQARNDAGKGYPASQTRYVGVDLPMQPQNLAVSYDSGTVTVSWDAVTSTVHGGYHNPDDVTYNVTLSQLDADGIATSLQPQTVSTTSATWQAGSDETLYGFNATVTPVFGTNSGDAAKSGYVWFGALRPPFLQTMTPEIDGWTPLNVGTGATWVKEYNSRGKGWAIPYNWGTVNNAWLFSPSIRLEKGRYYVMSLKAYSEVVNNEIQVYIGRGEATPDAMTTKLASSRVAPRTSYSKPVLVTFGFACEETGIYHLGLLNSFRSDTWTNVPYMFVNDVTCTPAPDSAPDAPQLTVDYDKKGAVKADITVKAPSATYGKTPVESLDKVILKVNGAEVNSWENVAAGTELTYTYEGASAGNYSFTAIACTDDVEGVPAMSTVFLGMSLPVDPEWVDVTEKADLPGTVDVSWAPVAKSANGQDIASEAITYNLMNIITNTYIERGVTSSPKELKICEPTDQKALYLSVNAETSAGVSSTYGTRMKQSIMHVGKPYDLPVIENFAGGSVSHSWSVVNQHSSYDRISVANAAELGGDANGDGYCLTAFVPYADSQCSLYSGTIQIPADANSPTLGFACFRQNYGSDEANDKNLNELLVSVIGTEHQGTLKPIVMKDQGLGWQYYFYDLSIFKGEKVNLLFTWHTVGYTTHWVDDIQFFDAPQKDLAVTGFSVPAQVEPDSRVRMSATVTNRGVRNLAKGDAVAELRRGDDGKLIATSNVPALQPFQSIGIIFNDHLNNSFDSEVPYKVTVVLDGDANAANDSMDAVLSLKLSDKPAPRALDGDRNDEGFAALTWQAPDLSPRYPMYEIGFESSTAPSMTDLEGFSTIDVDGNEVYGELGLTGPQGFTTFPHSQLAHSGGWMLVSPCNADGAPKEDWLISPKLSGAAQTLSFYVRTNWNAYESYTVLTSTTGSEKDDFKTTALEAKTTSNDWQRVDIDLPEGTLYFAIVSKADDTTDLIYLMLDDFTFEGADANDGLTVAGYNTYRDNEFIEKTAPVEQWEDLQGNPGPHFYRVTADYGDRGESAPSNSLFLFTRGTGVEGISGTVGRIHALPGRIVIEGADGADIRITDLSGITVAATDNAAATETFAVSSGVYLVTIDGSTLKLLVP